MAKSYSPVRAVAQGQGKESDGQIIPLQPTQTFLIVLTGTIDIEYNSPFFTLVSQEKTGKHTECLFRQTIDLSNWSLVSRVHLGEIIAYSDEGISKFCVYLDSPNKQKTNHVSIINPINSSLRVSPSSLIEVVVYETDYYDPWEYKIIDGEKGIRFEQTEHLKFDTRLALPPFNPQQVRTTFYMVPRSTLFNPEYKCKEHHYWFKCVTPPDVIRGLNPATYHGGHIMFDLNDRTTAFKYLTLFLKVGQKDKTTALITTAQKQVLTNSQDYKHDYKTDYKLPTYGHGYGDGYHNHYGYQTYHPRASDYRSKNTTYVYHKSVWKRNVVLTKKEDTELDSKRVFYY